MWCAGGNTNRPCWAESARRTGQVLLLTAFALLLGLILGCGRATDRPLRGAAPGTEAPATVGLPPTLVPSEALRFRSLPSPSPGGPNPSPGASPSASVAPAPPIVRTISPAANGNIAAGAPVTVSAVLVGRGADLATASLAINGADSGAQIDKRSPREWMIHSTQPLAAGAYTARVLVRDSSGASGGFTWQFTVGEAQGEPAPGAVPPPTPTRQAAPPPQPAPAPQPTPTKVSIPAPRPPAAPTPTKVPPPQRG